MALVACVECKREISTAASACPFCGHKERRSSAVGFFVALVLLSGGTTVMVGAEYGVGFFVVFGLIGIVVLALRR